MFNLKNINDYEFEILCKDILEAELKIDLRTYKKGQDKGIDIRCFSTDNNIIAQAKHYIKSNYSSLKSDLKKEREKVEVLNPENYYVFTSMELSPKNEEEIYYIFEKYMDSTSNIYDGIRITEILSKESSLEIVKKNYKLWLTSSNVLDLVYNKNVFIDTEALMVNIQNESKIFVETQSFYDAINILNETNIIIILGDPGTGKTVTSKMLLLHYASKRYKVRYASDNSLKDIKNAISVNPEHKEIIILDDFLGQHYLNIKEDKPSEVYYLMSYISRNKNKKLILNSRITIFKEAERKNIQFSDLIKGMGIKKYVIDLNKMSIVEKGRIFYNHLYYNDIPAEYFGNVRADKRYIEIVIHNNYNPRIIEYVTKPWNYNIVKPTEYFAYIMEKLDDPADVWSDEFQNRIDKIDRMFMNTLFSLTDTIINESIMKECFDYRAKQDTYDTTRDLFTECIRRLSEAMIKIVDYKGIIKIGVINPSINDYLKKYLSNNVNEISDILKNSIYIEQVNKIGGIDAEKAESYKAELFGMNNFLSLKSFSTTIDYKLLLHIYNNGIKADSCKQKVNDIILNTDTYSKVIKDESSKFLYAFFNNEELYEFYNLKQLLFKFEKMKVLFNELIYGDILNVLSIYDQYEDNGWAHDLEIALDDPLKNCIIEEVEHELEEDISSVIYDVISQANDKEIRDYCNDINCILLEDVENMLIGIIDERISGKERDFDQFSFLSEDAISNIIEKIDVREILDQFDLNQEIMNYLSPEELYEYEDRFGSVSREDKFEKVHEIFNRDCMN